MICRFKNISKAYIRLQKENKELLSIQHISQEDLEAARSACVSRQRLPRAPSAGRQSPAAAVPRPPSPPLSAQDLRAARLKYFCQKPLVAADAAAAADTPDYVQRDDFHGSVVSSRALCFKGNC